MKKFKGFQREANQFDNYCKSYTIHYSQARCHKALKEMILGASLQKLRAVHGKHIEQCFTENDLNKFK